MYPNKEQEGIFSKTNVDKRYYEKAVSECKKLRTFIKSLVEINITVLSKKNTIMSGFNIDKLLILLKFQKLMIKYI